VRLSFTVVIVQEHEGENIESSYRRGPCLSWGGLTKKVLLPFRGGIQLVRGIASRGVRSKAG
jgi:hypothetical protein